jgi:hypothetical protein
VRADQKTRRRIEMLLENKNAMVYGGEGRSAARSPAPSPAKGLKCSSPVEPLRASRRSHSRSASQEE